MGTVSLAGHAGLSLSNGETSQFDAMVKGARCASCLGKIEKGVGALPGVTSVRLNLSTGKLVVAGKDINADAVLQRVKDLGYEAAPFEASATLDADAREGRLLLHCLVVAGFGTVFTMGLTDSIWYGGDMDAGLSRAFFWLAGAVAIPATLYSGQPFFFSAWRVLKQRRANMDVPISLALLLSLALSVWQTAIAGRQVYFDAAVMLSLLLLAGRYLEFLLRNKARGAARHLLAMQSILVRRQGASGALENVAAADLNPGDHLLLANGERTPVDGELESETELDLSLVTGESVPVSRLAGAKVSAGSIVTGAPALLRVSARVEHSLIADLARLLEAGRQGKSVYVTLADRAARAYVPFVAIASLAVLAGWLLASAGLTVALTNAITVLIVTCPCALGLAVPAAQIAATGRLFRRGLFIKSGDALERLAEVDRAVFDKTGTLTLGRLVLENAESCDPQQLEQAARLARASSHPLARALAEAAGPGNAAPGVTETAGHGLAARVHGGVARLGNAAWCGIEEDSLATSLWFRHGADAPVRFDFQDQIRPESRQMLAALEARGIVVEMLTGDRAEPAAQIARDAGVKIWRASVKPQEKSAYLQTLSERGYRVLMVGDGINDAAAMALAHVSIAPGTATDISQRTADMVLRSASLSVIVEAVDVARKTRQVAMQNFILAGIYNIAAVPLAAFGMVTPLMAAAAMASSSLLVTLNALRLAGWRAS
jgi:Cu2+-exporting ATPase